MTVPDDLDEIGRAAFAEAWAMLSSGEDDPEHFASGIAAYARARQDVAKLRAAWALDGDPPYAVGTNDRLVVHPMVKGIHDAERIAVDLAKSLALVPATKRKVGRPPGSTHAKDRLKRAA